MAPRPRSLVGSVGRGALVVVAACGSPSRGEPREAPPKVVRIDPLRIGSPGHSPEALAGPGKPTIARTTGSFEFELDGAHEHFEFLPIGTNSVVIASATGLSRLRLSAARSDQGFPSVRIRADEFRLDRATLPLTLEHASKHLDATLPVFSVQFRRDETRWWMTRPGDPGSQSDQLILESLDGRTLRGQFRATLFPRKPDFGDPLQIAGSFESTLRGNGLEVESAAPTAD